MDTLNENTCYILDADDVLFHSHSAFLKWGENISDVCYATHVTEFHKECGDDLPVIQSSKDALSKKTALYCISACGTNEIIRNNRHALIKKHYNIPKKNILLIEYNESKNPGLEHIIRTTDFKRYVYIDDCINRVKEAQSVQNLEVYLFNSSGIFNDVFDNQITDIADIED